MAVATIWTGKGENKRFSAVLSVKKYNYCAFRYLVGEADREWDAPAEAVGAPDDRDDEDEEAADGE